MSSFIAGFGGRHCQILLIAALLIAAVPASLSAKPVALTAIEIYPGLGGPGFLQVTGFILNGKNEVYLCANDATASRPGLDKNSYHQLTKLVLGTGMILERHADGVLFLTNGPKTFCVVPGNIKYDKDVQASLVALADKAIPEGTILPGSDPAATQIFPIKPGVKLVFVNSPNQELAEYLRADREGDIPGWQKYLDVNATGFHATQAKSALSGLFVQAGKTDLDAYLSSKSGAEPDYAKLRGAREMASKALAQASNDLGYPDLIKKIRAEVSNLSARAKEELGQYLAALKQQQPGYVNLLEAEKLADAAISVDPSVQEALDAATQVKLARGAFDKALLEEETALQAQDADQAAQKITPLRGFAQENSKVSNDLLAIAALYLLNAKKMRDGSDWAGAVKEIEKSSALVPSPESAEMLITAKKQAQIAANKAAAAAATQKSEDADAANDIILAFQVLDDLPAGQRAFVSDRMDSLKDKYVQAAETEAKNLEKAHEPINGIVDERGIQQAYQYLQRCFRLTSDPTLSDRIALLAEDLSTYYLKQGTRYADKPDGTGVNVGWTYLLEALIYKSDSTFSAVQDERTKATQAHLLKSRISVGVDFRDQTSRREAVNFAEQLTDALATGLESSSFNVKVIRPGDAAVVQPTFQLVGDVLLHDLGKSQDVVPKESKYRSGEQPVPNPAWNAVNRDLEQANNDLQTAQKELEGAASHDNKKEMAAASKDVEASGRRVKDVHAKLDSIPQTLSEPVERPYTYTQTITRLNIVVDLQFRVVDSSGNEVVPEIQARKEFPTKEYSIFENVKPEDTQGVRSQGAIPNDNEYFEKAEYEARDELIKDAEDKVAGLPAAVLTRADRKAAEGDSDGAAELYILYLNSTPVADTPERGRVKKFLADSFNFEDIGNSTPVD